jgi:hypothetical protein
MKIPTYNINFFEDIDSPEKAWVMGWIYGDGHVRNSYNRHSWKIAIGNEDIDVLKKIKELIDFPHEIKSPSGYPILDVNSKKMVLDLNKAGIPSGKKSKILIPPTLHDELYPHFWRGVIESDGSFFEQKKLKSNSFTLTIGGNENTCLGFKLFMGWNNKVSKGSNYYTIRKTSDKKEFWEKIKEMFYDEYVLKNGLFLDRKFNILKNILERVT